MSWLRRFGRIGAVGVLVGVALGCGPPIYTNACRNLLVGSTAGPVTDPALVEISGIHAGVRNPGVWWVHNDSGDTSRIFALDANGATRGVYTLTGAAAQDWEDIAVVPGPTEGSGVIYVGDIGDNAGSRSQIQVYRVTEPSVPATGPAASGALTAETLRLTYPDGPHDAETLIVDPIRGDLLVVSKRVTGGPQSVYRAPAGLAHQSTTQLEKVEDVPSAGTGAAYAITGGDVSATGDAVVLRTYGFVRVYPRVTGNALWTAFRSPGCNAAHHVESQGEAVGFDPAGTALVTVGEGTNQTIHISTVP
jgi:hypothetical protein